MSDLAIPTRFEKILVIRRDNIGDLLCTTPLLTALRHRYPDSHIAVLANSYNAPVLEGNPDIDAVYRYTKAKHADVGKWRAWWRQARLYLSLRRLGFDLVINGNPVFNRRTARLVSQLAAPWRLGALPSGESVSTYYNIPVSKQEITGQHHVEQVFSLLHPLGISGPPPAMTLCSGIDPPTATAKAVRIAVHLSSRRMKNRWPVQFYEKLLHVLLKKSFSVSVFWAPGGRDDPHHPGDDEMAEHLRHCFSQGIDFIPTQTLAALIAAVEQTDLVVCPDGGMLHLSAALGKKTVALFGCTNSAMWGPWAVEKRILNGNGDAANIQPDEVVAAIVSLLGDA